MTKQQKIDLINRAMSRHRGNLSHVESEFRGMSKAMMKEQHGLSGRTRQEILDIHRQHDGDWTEANDWLQELIKNSP